MRRHAKASSAGSTLGRGAGLDSIRGALATRGVFSNADGSSALSNRCVRGASLVVFALALAVLTLTPIASAAVPAKGVVGFFGSNGIYAGQMKTPRGVAVNQSTGATYVVDGENNRVVAFDADGGFLRAFGRDVVAHGPGDNDLGFEICVPASGDVCKTAQPESSVGGTGLAGFGGQLTVPQGLAINQSTGDVYVSDQQNFRVQQFDAGGNFIRAFGRGVVAKGPGNQPGGAEVQTITVKATSGAFRLKFGPNAGTAPQTAPIPFNAPATGPGSVEAALNALPTIGAEGGSVSVAGGPGDATGSTPYAVTFGGSLSGEDVPQITIEGPALGMPTGTLLTCSSTTAATTTTFQWLRNGVPIPAANASTYTTVAADEGDAVQCRVTKQNPPTVNNTQGTGATQTSNSVIVSPAAATAPPQLLSASIPAPAVEGSVKVGASSSLGKLVCETAEWSGEPSFSYQWYRNGVALAGNGADTAAYSIQAADLAARASFQCAVTASNAGGSVTKVSSSRPTTPAPAPVAPGGHNTTSPNASVAFPASSTASTTQGVSVLEICTAANGDVCKRGISGSAGGEFKSTFSGQLAVAPAGAPNAGNVLVADPANRRVQEFTPAGAFVRAFGFDVETGGVTTFEVCAVAPACKEGTAGAGAGQFANNTPTAIAADSAGNIYTVEPTTSFRVQKFTLPANVVTPEGTFAEADLKGSDEASAPRHVAIDPASGNLLVSKGFVEGATPSCPITGAASVAENRVLEVSPAGALEGSHGTCAGIDPANGVAVNGAGGQLYLSSTAVDQRVYVLNTGHPVAPTASITNVSDIGSSGATLSGLINPNGPVLPYGLQTTYQIEFKRSAEASFTPLSGTEATAGNGTTTKAITATLEGLQANTSYDVRLVANKGFGSGSASQIVSFSTEPAPPAVALAEFPAISGTEARLEGTVKPNNQVTGYRFEYVDQAGFEADGFADATHAPAVDASAGSGASPVAASETISGLSAGETYHYRLIASNSSGQSIASGEFTVPAAPGNCPNASLRSEQTSTAWPAGSSFLPACMGIEIASPPRKFNQNVEGPNFSVSDDRLKFGSIAALVDTPKQASITDDYVSSRTSSGWVTEPTSSPPQYVLGSGQGGSPCSYNLDFTRWIGWGSTVSQGKVGSTTAFVGNLGGAFQEISPTLVPTPESNAGGTTVQSGGICYGGTADASHIFFSLSSTAFLPGDPAPLGSGLISNVYDAYLDADGTPTVELLQRDKNGKAWGATCGAAVGGGEIQRGAISADGSRVYLSTRPSQIEGRECRPDNERLRILKRLRTSAGAEITEISASECARVSPPCDESDSDDIFRGANLEGDRVFFTTSRQLADSDLDTDNDLYLYDATRPAGSRLTQVSAGDATNLTPGKSADVLGVVDLAGDGSRAYFVARGKLTATPNGLGDVAEPGEPNLYMYQRDTAHPGGHIVFIGTLAAPDTNTWSSGPGNNEATAVPVLGPDRLDMSVGGDGHVLAFFSNAALTPDDADGGSRDLYRYNSLSGALERVSRAAPGGSDSGSIDARRATLTRGVGFRWPTELSIRRWVSEDGGTIAFVSSEALDPNNSDGGLNIYVWRDGELTAITATKATTPSGDTAAVSMSGETVAFTSSSQLLAADGDSVRDIYVARAGGGFPIVKPPAPCAGEACQGAPASAPAGPAPASESPQGSGNIKKAQSKRRKANKKRGKNRRGKQKQKQRKQRQHKKHSAQAKQGGRK